MLPGALLERQAGKAKQVGGRLCLDFANLVGGWEGVAILREDRLTTYVDLLAWAWRAQVLDDASVARLWDLAETYPCGAGAVLARARRLREAIHAVAWSFERSCAPRPADLDVLASEVMVAREHQRLTAADVRLEWSLPEDTRALDAPLWAVALSAESFFTSADLTRLRSCPGESCGWHFEDQTRNRSRQWCDMGECGNVAKVRRFRARQRKKPRQTTQCS
jgi:predicted RNA-binding Zn ribbon-like protein